MSLLQPVAKMFGLEIYAGDEVAAVEAVAPADPAHELITIATPNPEQIVQAQENDDFHASLQSFDLLLPDGVGLVLASQLLALSPDEQRIKARITGTDFLEKLLFRAYEHGHTVLVVGGREYGTTENTVQLAPLKDAHYPELHTPQPRFFWTAGYKNVAEPTEQEEKELTALVKRLKPEMVFVSFGAPHQEFWVESHREVLSTAGVQTVMVVGGAFDFLLGKVQRAPELLQGVGLEWLYRLVQEPWRWKRQLRLFTFAKHILQEFLEPHISQK